MNYKKISLAIIILAITSIIDILWFKMGDSIKSLYLANNNIRYILEIVNGILKVFWHLLPFLLVFVSIFHRNIFFRSISINNLIHFLVIVSIVLFLKYTTGKARPDNATNPFDYEFINIYSIKQENEKTLSTERCYKIGSRKFCILRHHDSFPSGETAIAAVQGMYLSKFIGYTPIILSMIVPILRLSLFRHWWVDCVFSVMLSFFILDLIGKIRKKHDYNVKEQS